MFGLPVVTHTGLPSLKVVPQIECPNCSSRTLAASRWAAEPSNPIRLERKHFASRQKIFLNQSADAQVKRDGWVSLVSYSHPSFMIIASQFHVYLPWVDVSLA